MNFKSSKVRPMNLWPKKTFFAQKFYLRTLTKIFSLRKSSIFHSKVLFANFDRETNFKKFESSEKELLAKKTFLARKFYLRTFAKKFSLRESSIFHSKVLFMNFRTFQKCESSEIELLPPKFFPMVQSSQKCAVSPPPV